MAVRCPESSVAYLISIRDPLLIGMLVAVAVGAYILGALSYYAFTKYSSRALNRYVPTRQTHTDHPGKASSYGIDGSFTPIRATFPSFTDQYNSNAEGHASNRSLSSGARGHKVPLHSDIELGPHPGMDILSPPYFNPAFALNGPSQTPGSAASSSQSFISATLVSPAPPRRPTTENLKPVPLVKISPVTSEQPTPVNHNRSYSVPEPSSPVVQQPASSVAWHLPSRSRSMTKLRDDFKHEHSDSEYSLYGMPIPSPTATPDREGKNRPIVLGAKIFEASRALTPSPTVYNDSLLSVRDSAPSPTQESVMKLYESFPAPPKSNPIKRTEETRPRATSDVPTIRASAPTTAHPTTVPPALKRPVRPLTIQTHRGGPVLIPYTHQGQPNRPHTASSAGALSVPTSRPCSTSSTATLASPKRVHKSISARGSLVSLTDDSFLMPPRTPPTPRSPSLSSFRSKPSPRPVSSRNALYIGSGMTTPQPDQLSFGCKGDISATPLAAFTPRSL